MLHRVRRSAILSRVVFSSSGDNCLVEKFHAYLDYAPCQNLRALEVDDEALYNNSTNHNMSVVIIRSVATRLAVAHNVMKVERIVSSAKPPVAVTSKEWVLVFESIFCFLFDLARLYRTWSCRCRGCLGSHRCHRPTLRPPAATTCSPTMRPAFSSRILAMSAVNIAKIWCLAALSTGRTAAMTRTPWAA